MSNLLLSSQARIQVPWVKVTIGEYTFGIFDGETIKSVKSGAVGMYSVKYPEYITGLEVIKINGQVNTYTLSISYPITQYDDPNFFEKVFSSVSKTRKIVFTYGDANMPAYVYKNEEAIITKIQQSFDIPGSTINYTVEAVSSAALTTDGSINKPSPGVVKPSDEIKKLFKENKSLQSTFRGMKTSDLDKLIAGDDMPVYVESKTNISAIDYINFLCSCMAPSGSGQGTSKEIYALTIHDDSSLDNGDSPAGNSKNGPYFKVTKASSVAEHSDAYILDVGYNTSTIVRALDISQQENYSIYYDYQQKLHPEKYSRRIGKDGRWEDVFSPTSMSRKKGYDTTADDQTWWTKATQFPISVSVKIQGLLRPATLMQYIRMNVIFPGGRKHLSSGLYIVTRQVDTINNAGYVTALTMTRINGDQ